MLNVQSALISKTDKNAGIKTNYSNTYVNFLVNYNSSNIHSSNNKKRAFKKKRPFLYSMISKIILPSETPDTP
jgi:hypothetical protein